MGFPSVPLWGVSGVGLGYHLNVESEVWARVSLTHGHGGNKGFSLHPEAGIPLFSDSIDSAPLFPATPGLCASRLSYHPQDPGPSVFSDCPGAPHVGCDP